MVTKKKILIISIIILLIVGFIAYNQFFSEKKSSSRDGGTNQQIKREPLTAEERGAVIQAVSSSEFVEDLPGDEPIRLTFFDFDEEGDRVWQDSFLIGEGGIITKGTPTISLTLHSKYIPEIENDLCGTIKKANQNRDLGFQSKYNKASLLWKYKGMLQYRECFGF
ncbi:MAG: hypothetical protein ABIB79_01660 [archaeon]